MDGFKEFNGKDIDSAIGDACAYFDSPREKLEIEIIQDAKSGIFGIVGARKAKIRARRAALRETARHLLDKKSTPGWEQAARSNIAARPAAHSTEEVRSSEPDAFRHSPDGARRAWRDETRHDDEMEFSASSDQDQEEIFYKSLEALDAEKLEQTVKKVAEALAEPIAGQPVEVETDISEGRVYAHIPWTGDAGLIIGREGQTLEALEYLASRMVSHAMKAGVKVQLDIGEYRARQEDKLRQTAIILAEKALHSGRPYSTRPLSSYHRRIIHLALQDMPEVTTRSAGEGPMKRVIIASRRTGKY